MAYPSEKLLRLWVEVRASAFPESCLGRELDGIDLMSLQTYATGCVSLYVGNACSLDAKRAKMLKTTLEQLNQVVPQLDGEARVYFDKLRQLTAQVVVELFNAQ